MSKFILNLVKVSSQRNLLINDITRLPQQLTQTCSRNIHTTLDCKKFVRQNFSDNIRMNKVLTNKVEGEDSFQLMSNVKSMFPTAQSSQYKFGGILYDKLPIINIKATRNNTIMGITDCNGLLKYLHSAGCNGFKNAKKGTNVAAQQTAMSFANRLRSQGFSNVRVRIQGIGAGRLASIKGLQMGGLQIVSITDDTRVTWSPKRPRKPRRI